MFKHVWRPGRDRVVMRTNKGRSAPRSWHSNSGTLSFSSSIGSSEVKFYSELKLEIRIRNSHQQLKVILMGVLNLDPENIVIKLNSADKIPFLNYVTE